MNSVLIAYASREGLGEPAHPHSLARTSAARSYKQWVKRNLQTESQIPSPSEWLGMRSYNLPCGNARRCKFAWRGSNGIQRVTFRICIWDKLRWDPVLQIVEPEFDNTNKMSCNECSGQSSLCFLWVTRNLTLFQACSKDIRLSRCPGWSKSSLGAQGVVLRLRIIKNNFFLFALFQRQIDLAWPTIDVQHQTQHTT